MLWNTKYSTSQSIHFSKLYHETKKKFSTDIFYLFLRLEVVKISFIPLVALLLLPRHSWFESIQCSQVNFLLPYKQWPRSMSLLPKWSPSMIKWMAPSNRAHRLLKEQRGSHWWPHVNTQLVLGMQRQRGHPQDSGSSESSSTRGKAQQSISGTCLAKINKETQCFSHSLPSMPF